MNHEILENIFSIAACCDKPMCSLDGGFLRYDRDLNKFIKNQDELVELLSGVDIHLLIRVILKHQNRFNCLLRHGMDEDHLNQFLRIFSESGNNKIAGIISKQFLEFEENYTHISLFRNDLLFKKANCNNRQFYLKHMTPELLKDGNLRKDFREKLTDFISDIEVPDELKSAFKNDDLVFNEMIEKAHLNALIRIEQNKKDELLRIEAQKVRDQKKFERVKLYAQMPFSKAFYAMVCDNEFTSQEVCETYNVNKHWLKNIDALNEILDIRHVKSLLKKITTEQSNEHPFALQLKQFVATYKINTAQKYRSKHLSSDSYFMQLSHLSPHEKFNYFINSDLQVKDYPWRVINSVTHEWITQLTDVQSKDFMKGLWKLKSRRSKKKHNELIDAH